MSRLGYVLAGALGFYGGVCRRRVWREVVLWFWVGRVGFVFVIYFVECWDL